MKQHTLKTYTIVCTPTFTLT